jgi:alkanesulfonate monooxygenase SsuD/methylene tetrahydromethanopterin reductase-like flavin-dependent oxidoreductase (luciferase family)
MDKAYEEVLKKLGGIEEGGDKKENSLLQQVLTKLASATDSVTLSKEEASLLRKVAEEALNESEDEADIQVVDADGDGTPDTIVGDPEVIVSALEELVQAGVLSPAQYQMALQWIQMHLTTEEDIEKSASALSPAAQKLLTLLGGNK